ncbi:PQQ-binding-like beta-propeller repeat protein [Luteimonas aquatica]|uniref:outer membrane protein assembly factor BamB family protein n=1 Tax=Luteimonas aquatica TaxID=450364 RepID=UPI001F5AA550|nr:PQQ-binding-like beta-propeller repeat protein [Luteimonas aquatica]
MLQFHSEHGEQVSRQLRVASKLRGIVLEASASSASIEPNPAVVRIDERNYAITVRSAAGLAQGTYAGYITVKACYQAPCTQALPGGTALVGYQIVVDADGTATVGEWQTFQRDAGHSGYVPMTLQPASFAYKWEWRRATPGVLGFINAVATEAGKVFVSDDEYSGSPAIRALKESDGSLLWQHAFTDYPALNPPAASDGKVYVTTTGHEQTFLWAFDSATGAPVFQSAFGAQWSHLLAPTVRDGRVFTNGGYYGGGVYAYDAATGASQWSMFSGDDDMTTPAVDGSKAYYYDGSGLRVYDAATGSVQASIADPYDPEPDYSYHGAPMLGSPGSVVAFSGGAFSGRASSSTEQYDSRPLVNYSIAEGIARWRTARNYLTQPATAKGVVYAAGNNPKSFDAIDEATGEVLWSWTPGPSDLEFHRNVVVTDNLVFVSTDRAVYALDLATHEPVWSYPAPGMLAISGSGTLYIVEGAREPTGRLIAIALK